MIDTLSPTSEPSPTADPQADLPGIPRGSSLHDILLSYGLVPAEAPGGLRRFRHELTCNNLRAIAEVWVTANGDVDSFRIWSLRPRMKRGDKTPSSS